MYYDTALKKKKKSKTISHISITDEIIMLDDRNTRSKYIWDFLKSILDFTKVLKL